MRILQTAPFGPEVRRLAIACRCGLILLVSAPCCARASEPELPPRPLAVVEPGTVVDDASKDRWNKVVLLATPRFTSGDIDGVSSSIRENVTRFTFAVLATVRQANPAADGDSAHELVEVGVGYCTMVNGRLTVIAPDTKVPGFSTDFLGRQVLTAKQKSLAEIMCVGRRTGAVAFDSPMIMLRGDTHDDLVVRHLVRLDARTGVISTCAWLLENGGDGRLRAVEQPLRIVEGGTREERSIHVDGSLFSFGFPTKRAFAIEDLPPGKRLDWPASLREAGAATSYSESALNTLSAELDAAITSLRTLRSAER